MKLDWRQGILYIAALGMEGCWLYALISLLNNQAAGGRLSAIGVLLLYPLAFVFNALLQRLRWHRFALRSISWLAWVAGMLLIVKVQLFADLPLSNPEWLLAVPQSIAELIYTFKPELLILLSTGVIWWLGRRLATHKANFTALVSEFQFGLVILVITFLIGSQLSVSIGNAVLIVLTFFLYALAGISVAHALEGTSWLSGLYQGHWSGLLLISISFILILGLLISSVVTPELLQLVWSGIKWIWAAIMTMIAFLVSLLPASEPAELPPAMPMPGIEPNGGFKPWTMPEAVRSGLRITLGAVFFGLALVALWQISSQIFGWLRRKLASMAGAEFEPLPGAFRADLLALLKRLLSKLFGLRLAFGRRTKSESLLPGRASVRQIYRQLLRWAAASGYPRDISQTPHEYYYALADVLPEAQGDLDFITQQYVRTRYGASLPTEYELQRLSHSWHRVKQSHLKKVKTEHLQEKEAN